MAMLACVQAVATAHEPAQAFLEALRERNYFDVAGIRFLRGAVWAEGAPNPVVETRMLPEVVGVDNETTDRLRLPGGQTIREG